VAASCLFVEYFNIWLVLFLDLLNNESSTKSFKFFESHRHLEKA
jgi:hypothetical protein